MQVEVITIEKSEFFAELREILGERTEPEQPEIMTLAQTAAYFNKSKQAITNWTKLEEHPLPCGYLGSDPVFYRSEVVRWSKENNNVRRIAPTVKPPNSTQKNWNVYFIQAETGGAVKIGVTTDVVRRLNDLQRGSPSILQVVHLMENVPLETERELHKKFAAHRLHGEWFSEEILQLI